MLTDGTRDCRNHANSFAMTECRFAANRTRLTAAVIGEWVFGCKSGLAFSIVTETFVRTAYKHYVLLRKLQLHTMGSTKKHKKDRESSKKHKRKSRSRSPLVAPPPPSLSTSTKDVREREKDRDRERDKERERTRDRRHHKRHKVRREPSPSPVSRDRTRHRSREPRKDYKSDSSDCVEVPLSPPPAPTISAPTQSSKSSGHRSRSASPMPENGAGDCLSIDETNKLRAKLGLKPLEVESSSKVSRGQGESSDGNTKRKDEWGEFYHKPAANIAEKLQADKLREKFKQNKEKRMLEAKIKRVKPLGEEDEFDDISEWVDKNREKEKLKKEAEKRSKLLEEMDEQFGVSELIRKETDDGKKKMYTSKNLKGLRVEHDFEKFNEGKTVILTLKDNDVLAEDGDTLVNVNMLDDERYNKNIENRKKNPNHYGYNVYEDDVDEFGQPIGRDVLSKYDEEITGPSRKRFTLGETVEEEQASKRRLLEVKAKLSGSKLETLNDSLLKLASDTYTETEMASFKKPKKKKVRKLRQKLDVKDLLPLADPNPSRDFGSRSGRRHPEDTHTRDDSSPERLSSDTKMEDDEEDELNQILSKARRLKQTESVIIKSLSETVVKNEIKTEYDSGDESNGKLFDSITLNATAEFCRTLGDIPTYGMSGNRDVDAREMMEFEEENGGNGEQVSYEPSTGTWNSVNPEQERPALDKPLEITEVAILDEEPDVGTGMAAALKLALSKGYLEKEESNRPSNTRMAHLQAKNYSIEDKAHEHDDKFSRRDRFHAGPISEFKEKDNYKPNVKLEYIDDNGHLLNEKEAFRYLSHKFHGKGPGKNKIEKRLKKNEQDGLMRQMSSTDTPLGTLTMLQHKQKETHSPYIVLSGSKQQHGVGSITKHI